MSQLTSLVFAEDDFRSIAFEVAFGKEESNKFSTSCVSCMITSNDSATRETSINFAEMESVAMLLSVGIAIIFSSLDMLQSKREKMRKLIVMEEEELLAIYSTSAVMKYQSFIIMNFILKLNFQLNFGVDFF